MRGSQFSVSHYSCTQGFQRGECGWWKFMGSHTAFSISKAYALKITDDMGRELPKQWKEIGNPSVLNCRYKRLGRYLERLEIFTDPQRNFTGVFYAMTINNTSKSVACLPLSGSLERVRIPPLSIKPPKPDRHFSPTTGEDDLSHWYFWVWNKREWKTQRKKKNLNSHSFCISRFPGTHPFFAKAGGEIYLIKIWQEYDEIMSRMRPCYINWQSSSL